MLIIIYGNLGTGKSTLAKILSEKKGYKLIRFDEVMLLFKDKVYRTQDNDFLLKKEDVLKVYETMHKLAKETLKQGKNVILESLYLKNQREDAKKIAKETKNEYVIIEVGCDEKEIKKRLAKRKKRSTNTRI